MEGGEGGGSVRRMARNISVIRNCLCVSRSVTVSQTIQ